MPWHRPGTSFAIPKNPLTGNAYRGVNVLSLWIYADEKKFERQIWASFKQWQELGAQVRKGEKASLIVKVGEWVPKEAREQAETEGEEGAKRLYAKPAYVFNAAQVDGALLPPAVVRPDLTTRLAHVDAFIAATGAEFREGGWRCAEILHSALLVSTVFNCLQKDARRLEQHIRRLLLHVLRHHRHCR